MNHIFITENRPGAEKQELFVRNHTLRNLEKLMYQGGHKRFDIDLYDDKADHAPSGIEEVTRVLKPMGVKI